MPDAIPTDWKAYSLLGEGLLFILTGVGVALYRLGFISFGKSERAPSVAGENCEHSACKAGVQADHEALIRVEGTVEKHEGQIGDLESHVYNKLTPKVDKIAEDAAYTRGKIEQALKSQER